MQATATIHGQVPVEGKGIVLGHAILRMGPEMTT